MEEQSAQGTLKGSKGMLGMPVYSIQEGQNLGLVKSLVIDAREKRLLAMVVEKRRLTKEEKLLPFAAVKSVGDDVVTVERGHSLERRGVDPAVMRALRRPVQPVGARCFTAGGKTMGKVEEYYFDTQSGSISQLEISDGSLLKGKVLVDGQYIIAMAPHTVMLADEALTMCRPVENNLLSSMEVARDKAAATARSTVTMLGNSLSKFKGGAKDDEQAEPPQETTAETDQAPGDEAAEILALPTAPETVESAAEEDAVAETEAVPTEDSREETESLPAEQPAEHSPRIQVEVLLPEEAGEAGHSVNESLSGMLSVQPLAADEEKG